MLEVQLLCSLLVTIITDFNYSCHVISRPAVLQALARGSRLYQIKHVIADAFSWHAPAFAPCL